MAEVVSKLPEPVHQGWWVGEQKIKEDIVLCGFFGKKILKGRKVLLSTL